MLLSLFLFLQKCVAERSFGIKGGYFEMDGERFRYVSAEFHYFRQLPESWEETIQKIAHCGCNVIQTYVAWNLHEPTKGNFNFEGIADIERFLDLCQNYGLYVILRPGPYICAEWDFGGLPYWLLREDGIVFRTNNEVYLKHCKDWLTVLYKKLNRYMYLNGGNIIMVQIENEYGSYKVCNGDYLNELSKIARELLGEKTQLFTTDGNALSFLLCGSTTSNAYATIDFGQGASYTSSFMMESMYNLGGPYVNSEYYTGWLDHWGTKHETRDPKLIAKDLDGMLGESASVSMYMFIGGTNFGFYNGANGGNSEYLADPTTYDYDAPLNEAGDMTTKYYEIQSAISHYFDIPVYDVKNSTKKAYGEVKFTEGMTLYEALPIIGQRKQTNDDPMTMEALDVDYGFTLYQSKLENGGILNISVVHDRAFVFVDQKQKAVIQRNAEKEVELPAGDLDILVENMGRLNYGTEFVDYKGLLKGVKHDGIDLKGWTMTGFNLTNIKELNWNSVKGKELPTKVPSFYRATFNVDEIGDTFLNPTGLVKGVAFVNNFNLGRYWTIGPQLTLYVPRHILKKGVNELVIFEIESQSETVPSVSFDDYPQIDIIQ
ncbi:Beta-galactosidase-1-like protein [Tritrichomonas foetus]|uniref:Beta-galactosidase-1-like protein n=1 Tax=Tritrichomonas foetus TaxID=1144522 RepID=A0A1J4L0M9_9EUKA|nr:Beta-galactosidase-1-like protein [Tritrichomonas foetus]|eukprot:OHT17081.1 Beta-galactosidase-1-like protein [Tritrichomonas foetus]